MKAKMNRTMLLVRLSAIAISIICVTEESLAQDTAGFTVKKAPAWTGLFDRQSGWTGADGIYSIPINGIENYVPGSDAQTFWVFSDTFVGNVDQQGNRTDTTMVNNTAARLAGNRPLDSKSQFYVARDSQQKPKSLVIPNTPNSEPDHWYWFGDGIAIEGTIHVIGYRMKKGNGGSFNFATDGIALISVDAEKPLAKPTQVDAPLFVPAEGDRGDIIFGAGIMANTERAGAPNPDGYIYIYGTLNNPFVKHLLAARVLPADFQNFSEWRFFDGSEWVVDINQVAPLTGRVSSECSVSPMPNGKYICVFQQDTIGQQVAIKIGESPIGPWGKLIPIYDCPEPKSDEDIFVYNAKAHPHLSKPGELLISYNVNSFDFWEHFRNADIYRPRFIRLIWNQ